MLEHLAEVAHVEQPTAKRAAVEVVRTAVRRDAGLAKIEPVPPSPFHGSRPSIRLTLTVKTAHADHRKYNDGDAYLGLEKYIFVHLLGYARRQHVTSNARFYVVLDKLKDKRKFDGLRQALNSRVRNESGRRFDMYQDVIGVESHTQVLVQAADVLAGCIAWVWNKHHEKRSDPKKVALAQRIATLANLNLTAKARADGVKRGHYLNFGYPTWRSQETHGFAIWER